MLVLGLTGSIGSGKSTTAGLFRELGVPVHDADATVHRLYAGPLAAEIEAAFPGTTRDGAVDRRALSDRLRADPAAFGRLERLVHPRVGAEERAARAAARSVGARLLVLDIPLLFETGAERRCHAVLVVTVDPEEQKRRVLARSGMTEALFHDLLARQMPVGEKIHRAHFRIDTGSGVPAARAEVAALRRALAAAVPAERTE